MFKNYKISCLIPENSFVNSRKKTLQLFPNIINSISNNSPRARGTVQKGRRTRVEGKVVVMFCASNRPDMTKPRPRFSLDTPPSPLSRFAMAWWKMRMKVKKKKKNEKEQREREKGKKGRTCRRVVTQTWFRCFITIAFFSLSLFLFLCSSSLFLSVSVFLQPDFHLSPRIV